MVPEDKRKLAEAVEASRLKLMEQGSFRDQDIAADVIAENPELWKRSRDQAALAFLVGTVHRSTKRAVSRTSPDQMALPGFKAIKPLVNMAGTWTVPGKAPEHQLEQHVKWLDARLEGTARRSKEDEAEAKEFRRLLRMVRVYGKGDPNFTPEQAIELRKRRRIARARKAAAMRWKP